MASTKYAIRGMKVELGCPVDANPPIRKTLWTKNEAIVEFSSRVRLSTSGSLMFDEIFHSDGGNYSCLPFSSIGPGRPSSPIQVLVKGKQMLPSTFHSDSIYQIANFSHQLFIN